MGIGIMYHHLRTKFRENSGSQNLKITKRWNIHILFLGCSVQRAVTRECFLLGIEKDNHQTSSFPHYLLRRFFFPHWWRCSNLPKKTLKKAWLCLCGICQQDPIEVYPFPPANLAGRLADGRVEFIQCELGYWGTLLGVKFDWKLQLELVGTKLSLYFNLTSSPKQCSCTPGLELVHTKPRNKLAAKFSNQCGCPKGTQSKKKSNIHQSSCISCHRSLNFSSFLNSVRGVHSTLNSTVSSLIHHFIKTFNHVSTSTTTIPKSSSSFILLPSIVPHSCPYTTFALSGEIIPLFHSFPLVFLRFSSVFLQPSVFLNTTLAFFQKSTHRFFYAHNIKLINLGNFEIYIFLFLFYTLIFYGSFMYNYIC
ncbi:hypothetical protein VP01_791g1 [Puccinia sorghi]|uniref:Uncharacterized protein n=1 Tax=Puccinia sorghi TaxID=27349 RepID=A0A0L6UCX2_9BASI|nr:hypothetical protein VP01_791g1 [Puccinia sorghi]